jgi:hypothetical protein
MDIKEFSSALPKPWLDVRADLVETNHVSFVDQEPIPNAPSGDHSLYFSSGGILSSVNPSGQITRYGGSPPMANVTMISFLTYSGSQTEANLLLGLSPQSTVAIPAGSLKIGDVCRFRLRANITAAKGSGCTITLGTAEEGLLFGISFAAFTNAWSSTALYMDCDLTQATATTMNIAGTGATLEGDPLSFIALANNNSGRAFNVATAHTLTCTYTTSSASGITIAELQFYRMLTT